MNIFTRREVVCTRSEKVRQQALSLLSAHGIAYAVQSSGHAPSLSARKDGRLVTVYQVFVSKADFEKAAALVGELKAD